jgi:hypothetical protein
MAEKQPLEIASDAIRSAGKDDREVDLVRSRTWLNAYMDTKAATRLAVAAFAALESAGFVLIAKGDQPSFRMQRVVANADVQISSS